MTAEISQDLILARTEGASGAPLDADVLVDASPPALSWAAIVTARRLSKHQGPTSRPLVKATLKRLPREYGKPRKQAKGFTSETMYHNRTRRSARFASRSRCETLLVQRSGIAAAP